MKINFVLSLLIFSLILLPAVSFAQATDNRPSIFDDPTSTEAAGNAKCFDYYHFGSVVIDISPSLSETIPGATLHFSGTITNQNTYPLTDLDLYVKIFRQQDKEEDVLKNGHNLVAQFVAVDNISIDAEGNKEFSFDWPVPSGTIPGDYTISTYAMTNEAYNLSGLSFTDDVTGASTQFKISGEEQDSFAWDKNKVTMNDASFRFASMIPIFAKDEAVTITAPYVNNTKTDKVVLVMWKQYSWDGLREQALIDVRSDTFTVPAGSTKSFSYEATDYKGAVTYVVAEAISEGVNSILDMRFARTGVEQARINFPSLTNFPLVKDQPNAVFSCLHVVGPDTLAEATLDLTLTDKDGAVISQNKYEGSVTSAMMGVRYDFMPTQNYDQVTLIATLTRGGVTEDVGKVTYDCQSINANKCLSKEGVGNSDTDTDSETASATNSKSRMLMLIIVMAIIAIVGIFFSLKRRHNLPPMVLLIFAFMFGLTLTTSPSQVLAKSTTWTSSSFSVEGYGGAPLCKIGRDVQCQLEPETGSILPNSPLPSWYQFGWVKSASISGAVATVKYNTATNYTDGATVNTGDTITFTPDFTTTDISFNGTGSYSDSPYGTWGSPSNYELISTFAHPMFGTIRIYAALGISKPSPTVAKTGGSGTATCVGLSCTVNTAGTLTFRVTYPATTGSVKLGFNKALRGSGANIWYEAGTTYLPLPGLKTVQVGCPNNSPNTEAEDKQCYNAALSNQFVLSVPAQTIDFSFTAAAPNAAPNMPTITTITAAPAGSASDFSFRAADPDGDALHYEIDWDKNGTVDACAPSSCADVTSGTTRNASYTWSTSGSKTFQARTIAASQTSAWKTHTVSIPAAPAPSVGLNFQ